MSGVLFRCPVCHGALSPVPGGFRCAKGHRFDTAAQGYVNLLPARHRTKASGDSEEMVKARRTFLQSGGYDPLIFFIADQVARGMQKAPAPALLDAGCGEGTYTRAIALALAKREREVSLCGIDIAKPAVRLAARACKTATFAVASAFDLPFDDGVFGGIVDIFSPVAAAEFARVLCPGGSFWLAVPGPRHLMGLKEVLYDKPYENRRRRVEYPGFTYCGYAEIAAQLTLEDPALIHGLFAMTPYYWKTPPAGAKRLAGLAKLDTEIAFDLVRYQRA